jgi:hypothetical protein
MRPIARDNSRHSNTAAVVHCMWYSPGMGPVPFILAAESFSLATREIVSVSGHLPTAGPASTR